MNPTKPTTTPSFAPTVEPTVDMQKLFATLTKANNISVVPGSVTAQNTYNTWAANYRAAADYNKKSKQLKLGATSKFAFVTNSVFTGKAGLTAQRGTYAAANTPIPSALPTPTPKPSTRVPTAPTRKPTVAPSAPTKKPTVTPTAPTLKPTFVPSKTPSRSPSLVPSFKVTAIPTTKPSSTKPSVKPSSKPASKTLRAVEMVDVTVPTESPSFEPSGAIVGDPTASPVETPTASPMETPTAMPPADHPFPTAEPVSEVIPAPSAFPTESPTLSPTEGPTLSPSIYPSLGPSFGVPSSEPTYESTSANFGFKDWSAPASFGAVVSPVRDAGQVCVSAWAWVLVGAVESAMAIKKQQAVVPLSVQQIVNCESGGVGFGPPYSCNGGDVVNAFRWMVQTTTAVYSGMTTEAAFPYSSDVTGVAGHCIKPPNIVAGSKPIAVTRSVYGNGALAKLKAALDIGPVVVAVTASSLVFQLYLGGVITDPTCGGAADVNHYLLAVGYGVVDGIPYIKCKNSWGVTWGDAGYVLIGADETANYCGILTDFSYPTMP